MAFSMVLFLIEFIRECNPEVDTMEGRGLTEEEHERFYDKLMHDEIEYEKWFKRGFDRDTDIC